MKLFLAFFIAFFALVHALAVDTGASSLVLRTDSNSVATTLPNGTRKIELYDTGVYYGVLLETDNGGVLLLDASGNEVDISDDQVLQKRVWIWDVAKQWAKIIAKWGRRVWDFIFCIGLDFAWKCGRKFVTCAEHGQPPWLCAAGLACVGVLAKQCA